MALGDPVSLQDLIDAGYNTDFIKRVVESPNNQELTPDGVPKYTITGLENLGIDTANGITEQGQQAISELGFRIVGDFSDTSKVTITQPYEVYTSKSVVGFEGYIWRPLEALPYTPTGSDPTAGAEQGKWEVVRQEQVVLPEPDVSVPFNDGISIFRGYGSLDKNVTFTRASSTGNINKSGILEELLVDEPAITSTGLSVYSNYSNDILWSEDFNNPVWVKASGATISQDGTLAPDGINQAWLVQRVGLGSNLQQVVTSTDTGQDVTMSWFGKKGSDPEVKVRWISTTGGSTQDYQAVFNFDLGVFTTVPVNVTVAAYPLGDSWWQFYITSQRNNTGNTVLRLDIATQNENQTVYAWGGQIVDGSKVNQPYVKTTTAPVTRASDLPSIPMKNNMPAEGNPFTIVVDCAVPITEDTNEKPVIRNLRDATKGLFLRRQQFSTNIEFGLGNGTSQSPVQVSGVDDSVHRYCCVYDGISTISVYVDGTFYSSNSNHSEVSYDLDGDLWIGRDNIYHLDSEVKNLKIHHKTLSSAEILALGGPDNV